MNPDILTSEADMIAQGRSYLTGEALERRIIGKTVLGDFGHQFKFISTIGADGRMEGKNNAGAHDFGIWTIDKDNHTLSVRWEGGWESSTTHAYEVDGTLKFYQIGTGRWTSSFTGFTDGIQSPLNWPA